MSDDNISASTVINAPAELVFDVLADPSTHAAIDGTGWVRQSVDGEHLGRIGQIFRMGMYHVNHPNKDYEMSNRVEVFDRPRAIGWQPGSETRHIPGHPHPEAAGIEYGGWTWRYDLEPVGADRTDVTLTYDWSHVSPHHRDIEFPPFPPEHLDNSLHHLAEIAERA